MQLSLLKGICNRLGEDNQELLEKIKFLYERVFQKGRLTINMTGDAEGLSLLHGELDRMLESVKTGEKTGTAQMPKLSRVYEGISIPAEVCYVAKVIPAAFYREEQSAPLLVLSRWLSNNYLYNRIRVQGGAYGGMSQYEPGNGLFSFLSYRDPNLLETLSVYESAREQALRGIPERELEKAVIGTIGQIDRPMDPAGKGYAAMVRYFSGLTDELRMNFRNRVLDMATEDVLEAAEKYLAFAAENSAIAVYAPQNRLLEANERLEEKLRIEPLP